MKTRMKTSIFTKGIVLSALLISSCAETKKEDAAMAEKEVPMVEVASDEYSDIVLKTLGHMANYEHDAFAEHLADDIIWYWPDGSSETRHSIEGKDNLVSWWKNYQETTGATLNFANNTLLPLKINTPSNYYKVTGSGVLAYTDLTITLGDKSTSVRQHMVYMFNDDMKISHCFLYYDRSGIIELTNVVLGETEE
ncbi:hypothetical protein [uncultured Muriicola sp.]|uniref:hypothetical protein n=1 Tax=uncultured Muriicola sp. TaxID=1583102 RepID=UPI00260444F6|nr:hypothetical protein [uncultured Muriicola sp.]